MNLVVQANDNKLVWSLALRLEGMEIEPVV